MQARAIFRRKEVCFEPSECEIEKVIHLSDSDFARFQQTLLDNYDFLHENADLMRVENGVTHCLLVVGETLEDGILVNSEGSDYARYAAYFPNAKSFLLTQGQTRQVVQAEAPAEAASPSAVGGISAALLAYGEKMNRLVDLAIFQALECHDQSTYIISPSELQDTSVRDPFDVELFIAMLKERPEIVDMDVGDNGEVMVTLSLESIIEHDLSKLRVLTQDDVEIMYAKHILFNHDEGGEKADFSGCRLTNLDMRHMQLNGADFTGALLEGVRMNDAGLCFCTFRPAISIQPGELSSALKLDEKNYEGLPMEGGILHFLKAENEPYEAGFMLMLEDGCMMFYNGIVNACYVRAEVVAAEAAAEAAVEAEAAVVEE